MTLFFIDEIPILGSNNFFFIFYEKIIFILIASGFYFFARFCETLFQSKRRKYLFEVIIIIQILFLIIPTNYKDLKNNYMIVQPTFFIHIFYGIFLILKNVTKNREAFIISLGIIPAFVTIVRDITIRYIPDLKHQIYVSNIGVTILLLFILYSIILRFSRYLKETIELNLKLDETIKERTKDIVFKNELLQENDLRYTLYNENSNDQINESYIKDTEIIEGRKSIFIIDDNIEIIYLLQTHLSKKFNIYYSLSGEDALIKIKEIPRPDLIISDMVMGKISGRTVLEELKKDSDLKNIPFIFLTALNSPQEKIDGLKAGAFDYINKPFHIDEVATKIESIFILQSQKNNIDLNNIEDKIISALKNIGINENKKSDDRKKSYNIEAICSNFNLSNREKEVIPLLLEGLLNKEISAGLSISLKTVEFHIHNIYKKTNSQNKIELINKLSVFLE